MLGTLIILNAIVLCLLVWHFFLAPKGVSEQTMVASIDAVAQVCDRIERSQAQGRSEDRADAARGAKEMREEIVTLFDRLGSGTDRQLSAMKTDTKNDLVGFASAQNRQLEASANVMNKQLGTFGGQLSSFSERMDTRLEAVRASLDGRLAQLAKETSEQLEMVRRAMDERLASVQKDNMEQLERMRQTVDEKLQSTLEKRLNESLKMVSERLDVVHKGLGEMQTLATGVGDLKKVLSNVKTRGAWGEVQLATILEQTLSPEQYAANVATKNGSADRVEFAIKIPAKDEENRFLWLPVDAKFPLEDYQNLLNAQEAGDVAASAQYGKALEARVTSEAKDIAMKYIDVPNTTDFGILFVPIEGLYAEILRRKGLEEELRNRWRVAVCGPSTIWAFLSSLQMGFRTLAIHKRSSEVWTILGAVKADFGKFGDLLEKTQKKLQEASNVIDDAARKSRTIERKLTRVQDLPTTESPRAIVSNTDGDVQDLF